MCILWVFVLIENRLGRERRAFVLGYFVLGEDTKPWIITVGLDDVGVCDP